MLSEVVGLTRGKVVTLTVSLCSLPCSLHRVAMYLQRIYTALHEPGNAASRLSSNHGAKPLLNDRL